MSVLDGAFWVVSLVLLASGVTKLLDPAPLGAALVELGVVPAGATAGVRDRGALLGRALGAFEVVVGAAALVVGGRVTGVLVTSSYLVFTAIVAASWRRGLRSCGCFGASSSPPGAVHLVLNAVSTVVAFAAVVAPVPAVADGLDAGVWNPVLVAVLVLAGAVGVVVADTR